MKYQSTTVFGPTPSQHRTQRTMPTEDALPEWGDLHEVDGAQNDAGIASSEEPLDFDIGPSNSEDVPAAPGRARLLSERGWLDSAHMESPCCLRCGKHVARSRYHCSCCFCVVCGECSVYRLPGLRELRVCAMCYKDNMQRCNEHLHKGIRTETVVFTDDSDSRQSIARESWEVVEMDASAAQQETAILEIAVRPAPYSVHSAVLLVKPAARLFAAWKENFFMLDSNCSLASFSNFVSDPSHGTHATNQLPNFYVDLTACRELKVEKESGPLALFGTRVVRLMLSTPSTKILLGSTDEEEASVWKEALSLAGRLCYGCGLPCFGAQGTDPCDEKCVVVSDLPRLALFFHRDCFRCSRKGCDVDLSDDPTVAMLGRSAYCVTSGACRATRVLFNSDATANGGVGASVRLKWNLVNVGDTKEIFGQWCCNRAVAEAERMAKRRKAESKIYEAEENTPRSRVLSTLSFRGEQAELTSDILWRCASTTVVDMVRCFEDADPTSTERWQDCTDVAGTPFRVTEYHYLNFDYLRNLSCISRSSYAESFAHRGKPENLGGGRSSSLVLTTPDKRFIIKTIPAAEQTLLPLILNGYTQHLQNHPDSLISRICGMYSLKYTAGPFKGQKVAFITMYNVLHNPLDLPMHHIYDLKGSTVGRSTLQWQDGHSKEDSEQKTLKDMDLRRQLRVGSLRKALLTQLTADVRYLARLGIMDYSLVVGIHDCDSTSEAQCSAYFGRGDEPPRSARSEPLGRLHMLFGHSEPGDGSSAARAVYVFGVIDVLQEWNRSKETEAFVKSVVLGSDPIGISAVKPNAYARRFIATLTARCQEH
eukprot:m.133133 g.133133  ORF g.133133 m.133133 type:complete len:822 (-) comp13822_c0_seq1:156-2621(-)